MTIQQQAEETVGKQRKLQRNDHGAFFVSCVGGKEVADYTTNVAEDDKKLLLVPPKN